MKFKLLIPIIKIFVTYFSEEMRCRSFRAVLNFFSFSRKADDHARSVYLKRIAWRKSSRGNLSGHRRFFSRAEIRLRDNGSG